MATPQSALFAVPGGKPIRLVAHQSLFHDMFRKTYAGTEDARWLLAYLTWRNAISPTEVIVVTATPILREVGAAFRNIEYQLPRLLAATNGFIHRIDLPDSVPAKLWAIFVARILVTQGHLPVLVSSVDREKMLERIHEIGLDLKLEGFTEVMSSNRLLAGAWCFPTTAAETAVVLSGYDPLFQSIVQEVGIPPAFARAASSGKTPTKP